MKKYLKKATSYTIGSLLVLLWVSQPMNLSVSAQDTEYDEQQWWNPGDWFDDTPNTWDDTDVFDWNDNEYYESDRIGNDYYDTYDQDFGVGETNDWDWFTDDYWEADWNDTNIGTRDYSRYGDSAWDYDEEYWGDDWDFIGDN